MKFYSVLELEPRASAEEVKKAYKRLAVKHHPDKGGDPEKFKEISEAYQVLSDPEKKGRYDQIGDEGWNATGGGGGGGGGPFGGMDPFSIFEAMFGGGMRGHPMHHHEEEKVLEHTIRVSLAEAYRGITKNVKITFADPCKSCKRECGACKGRGMIEQVQQMGFMMQMISRPCNACSGQGFLCGGCDACGKLGRIQKEHQYQIEVPGGVVHGLRHMMRAENHRILFHIHINADPVFTREGHDLVFKTELTPYEAMVGKEIRIPHFDGDILWDSATAGVVVSGQQIRIPMKGMPIMDRPGRKGDLVVQVIIKPIGALSQEVRDRLRAVFVEEKLV